MALLPLAWFLVVGDRGILFGRHWDQPLLLADLRQTLVTGTLLPTGADNWAGVNLTGGHYEYGSVLYWLGVAMTAGPVWHQTGFDPRVAIDPRIVDADLFAIRLRQACLAVTSMAVVATFGLGWRATGRASTGLVAAVLLATSWEVNYHSRFVAPDGLLMAAAAACLLLCVMAVRRPRLAWAAAVAAGVATGTKYPGGLLCVPLLTAAALARRRWRSLPALFGVQLLTFVLTTPGCLLQPLHFAAWVGFNRLHYGTLGHFGHTILSHRAHALAMLEYLALVLPSHYRWASVAVSLLAVVGAVALCRRDWRAALVLLPFAALYVGYFSQQIVMIVRNLLVLAPTLAVLAGVGVTAALDAAGRLRSPVLRWSARSVVIAGIALVVALNGSWEWSAGGHMADRRTPAAQAALARTYLAAHPELRVYPSERAAAAVGLPITPTAGSRDVVLAYAQEDGDLWRWPANVPWLTIATFGPFPCNFDYYPNWMDDRLVLMDLAQARRVPVAQVERAVRRRDLVVDGTDGELLAYLDCGGATAATGHGVTVRAVNGAAYPCAGDVAVPQPDVLTIQSDPHALTFEIAGLDPRQRYALGWTWWDWNGTGRRTSVWAAWDGAVVSDVGTPDPARTAELLPPTAVPPWPLYAPPWPRPVSPWWPPRPIERCPAAAPRSAPLPPAAYARDGRCRVTFRREAAYDAIVSGLWVRRR